MTSGSSTETEDEIGHQWVESAAPLAVEVRVPPFEGGSRYKVYDVDVRIAKVLREHKQQRPSTYLVKVMSGHEYEVGFEELLHLPGGSTALELFHRHRSESQLSDSSTSDLAMVSTRSAHPKKRRSEGFIDSSLMKISDDELPSSRQGRRKNSSHRSTHHAVTIAEQYSTESELTSEDEISDSPQRKKARPARRPSRSTRRSNIFHINYNDEIPSESSGSDGFNDNRSKRKRTPGPSRRSDRVGRHALSMRERAEDDIPETHTRGSSRSVPKSVGAKEIFVPLGLDDDFRNRHFQNCDTCNEVGDSRIKGHLVFCQGCTISYHKLCLGVRNGREHLVTKVAKDSFVLQCRRCVKYVLRKEPTAPHQSKCQKCGESGVSCHPFHSRKSPKEEQKEREDNSGEDPVIPISQELINNVHNVMFRCVVCYQSWHVHHLPAKKENLFESDDIHQNAADRWVEYCQDWMCHECATAPTTVGAILAWRPKDPANYTFGLTVDEVSEDEKEYLIKWTNKSYNKSLWKPGSWVWGVTHKSMRIGFARRDGGKVLPKMHTEDAIPEDYLRVDIVFQIRYNNVVGDRIEEVDVARIREVDQAQVKFKGLGYEDVVWEEPPDPIQEPERWSDFKAAYEDWVRGRYVRAPASSTLSNNLRKVKALKFEEEVMLKVQPKSLTGGELMDYQLDGLNWIYYQWHRGQNAILADEMGLGKTIQVIGFLATLQEKHHCWPTLVVVPNATCANWRREIKIWAPSLRVVTYFGSAKARELSEKYELFTDNKKDLRCHVVVTSYDAAEDAGCQRILRRVSWAALVVDEGQRLKNDKNLLYSALSTLRVPFKLLLTGTPLQNNQRELFNLLQFLDHTINAESLAEKYDTLTRNGVAELHELLRPFFLRRTKVQVLDFLPTMAQIIVPVTMSSLQKELYKSILAKNAELLKSIFSSDQKTSTKGGLRNILMQLRKCLCHPFVYSLAIEERTSEAIVSHRRLVEASAKLQLLEIMLPKLKERGHRVLIFSQFLDMLTIVEDFLEGLGLENIRLDGTMGSLEKQRKIDRFNAPESSVFAFLLSTRAGGVGINLASADTVIILDPDFNPHQDIQAISRAHRIGQKKKVLVLQMMTRGSAEERIMQIGKKKMALDHVLIESMDEEDANGNDLESVLRFGAEALFKDDGNSDIIYNGTSVDKLLDRSQIEDTKSGESKSAESQFSFARVWQNETASMEDSLVDGPDGDSGANRQVWEQILAQRAELIARENKLMAENLGRGKRQRKDIDYNGETTSRAIGEDDPMILGDDDDTDFQARNMSDDDDSSNPDADDGLAQEAKELAHVQRGKAQESRAPEKRVDRNAANGQQVLAQRSAPPQASNPPHGGIPASVHKEFQQWRDYATTTRQYPIGPQPGGIASWAPPMTAIGTPLLPMYGGQIVHSIPPEGNGFHPNWQKTPGSNLVPIDSLPCLACKWFEKPHKRGSCPLKLAGLETCSLCGLAHFGYQRACPHLHSETQVRLMQEALRHSTENKELTTKARQIINGLKGSLIQVKKRKAEKAAAEKRAEAETAVINTDGRAAMDKAIGVSQNANAGSSRVPPPPQGYRVFHMDSAALAQSNPQSSTPGAPATAAAPLEPARDYEGQFVSSNLPPDAHNEIPNQGQAGLPSQGNGSGSLQG